MTLIKDNASYYYMVDGNKNITALVDENAVKVNSYEYSPFGKLTTESETVENPFKFSSEYADTETGLIYYNYRYYNPENGKWLKRDPIEEEGGFNLYSFVNNDSIMYIDLLGLKGYNSYPGTPGGDVIENTDKYVDTTLSEDIDAIYKYLYTGKFNPTDEEWNAAMDGAGEQICCWARCMKNNNLKAFFIMSLLSGDIAAIKDIVPLDKKTMKFLSKLVGKNLKIKGIGGIPGRWTNWNSIKLRKNFNLIQKLKKLKKEGRISKAQLKLLKKFAKMNKLQNYLKAREIKKLKELHKALRGLKVGAKRIGVVTAVAEALLSIYCGASCSNGGPSGK